MSAATIINTLWQTCDEKKLSEAQLQSLCQSEELALHLKNIAMFMDRVAAIKAYDTETGCLESKDDVSAMLWGLSSTIEMLASAVHVSGDAAAVLASRRDSVPTK